MPIAIAPNPHPVFLITREVLYEGPVDSIAGRQQQDLGRSLLAGGVIRMDSVHEEIIVAKYRQIHASS
jgi:hypothetical protein